MASQISPSPLYGTFPFSPLPPFLFLDLRGTGPRNGRGNGKIGKEREKEWNGRERNEIKEEKKGHCAPPKQKSGCATAQLE